MPQVQPHHWTWAAVHTLAMSAIQSLPPPPAHGVQLRGAHRGAACAWANPQANEELWLNISGSVVGDIQYAYGAVGMQMWELGVAVSAAARACCVVRCAVRAVPCAAVGVGSEGWRRAAAFRVASGPVACIVPCP